MADREQHTEHPVLTGLIALVGVALAVGLVLALVVLVGTKLLGLGGGSSHANSSSQASLYLPPLKKTTAPSGPLITLDQQAQQAQQAPAKGCHGHAKKHKPAPAISLSAGETAVAPMQQIDLTGIYPRGEGAVLQVERFTAGSWEDFAQITVLVSNQTFSTYVQTSQPGINKFRVVDTDTGTTSNVVRVRIG